MISAPQIMQTDAQVAAVIRLTIPRSEMMTAFGPAVGELMSVLADQKIEPVGGVFAHHLQNPSDIFDFELGVMVSSPIAPAGRVTPGQLPAAKVARTIYSGPYEGLSSAWGELTRWIKASGHDPAEDLWELYAVGPQATPDSTQWRTELNRPLRS